MELAGKIAGLRTQVVFELHANGPIVVGRYLADFVYFTPDAAQHTVEDCKGFRTPLYRWKKKHFEAEYGVRILET